MSRNAALIAVLFVLGAIGFVQAELQEAQRAPAERFVTVTNFPAVQGVSGTVNVGNLPAVQTVTGTVAVSSIPAAPPAKRFQFVGATAQTYSGNLGGILGAAFKCQMEFADSRLCTQSEYIDTTTLPVDPASIPFTMWARAGALSTNDISGCAYWASNHFATSGSTISRTGFLSNGTLCDQVKPLACCAPV